MHQFVAHNLSELEAPIDYRRPSVIIHHIRQERLYILTFQHTSPSHNTHIFFCLPTQLLPQGGLFRMACKFCLLVCAVFSKSAVFLSRLLAIHLLELPSKPISTLHSIRPYSSMHISPVSSQHVANCSTTFTSAC